MLINIVVFLIAITLTFGMLIYRAWEIRTLRYTISAKKNHQIIKVPSFRQIENFMLYSVKHVIQSIVIIVVKYWYIIAIKTRKKILEKWPKIHDYFVKKIKSSNDNDSFVRRAVIESKTKIKHIKEKIRRENFDK